MHASPLVNRAAVASWASIVGAVALALAGLLFLLQGEISTWVFALVVIGVGSLALWVWWAPGEFQAWLAGRQTQYGTTSILVTILFVAFVAFTYVLIDRANLTVDLTSRQKYSLNAPTLDAIDRLEQTGFRVRIVGFFSRTKLREQEAADLLLRLYEGEGGDRIEVEYIDPDERPEIAAQYGYQPAYDGQFFLSVLASDGEPIPGSVPIYLGGPNERDITTGLLTVASAGSFKVYFTAGHSEADLAQIEATGISALRTSLTGQGIIVEPLRLLEVTQTGIPEDASAVLIIGARARFTEQEVQAINDYVQRGGRLAIFADPPLVDVGEATLTNTFLEEGSPFSDYLWDEFGVRVQPAVVVAPDLNLGNQFSPIVAMIASHDILTGFEDAQIVMRFARPLELVSAPDARQGQYLREPLLYSSEGAYAEFDLERMTGSRPETILDGEDQRGPLLLGVTIRRSLEFQQEAQPRIVIIGDSDVLQNDYVSNFAGNNVLWSDTVDWLTGFSQAVRFAPISDPTTLALVVSSQQRTTIATITMVLLPGIVLLAGGVVWWYRRR